MPQIQTHVTVFWCLHTLQLLGDNSPSVFTRSVSSSIEIDTKLDNLQIVTAIEQQPLQFNCKLIRL